MGKTRKVQNPIQRKLDQQYVKDVSRNIKKDQVMRKVNGLAPVQSLKKQAQCLPNLAQHKKQMISSLQRKSNKDVHQKKKIKMLSQRQQQVNKCTDENQSLADYVSQIQNKVNEFEDEAQIQQKQDEGQRMATPQEAKQMAQSRKAYYKELKKVIEAADVIIEVLDARDPMGCRSQEIEEEALKLNKKIILILNKIDLVPPQNSRSWQKHLRNEFPCILFKANRQGQKSLGMGNTIYKKSMLDKPDMIEQMASQSTALGTENLMNILKNYSRIEGDAQAKQTISVGVVGFPNVGKSSLINSLKRQRAAATGNTPGVTKAMQEIQLDKNIILLDSPGVVLSTKEHTDSLILRQAIKIEDIEDPFRPVEALVTRIEKEEFAKLYELDAGFTQVEQLLGHVARKKGYLQGGGVPNFDMAARRIIRDYMDGKIPFFTPAPDGDENVMDINMDESNDQIMQ